MAGQLMKKLVYIALAALMLAGCKSTDNKNKKDNDHYIPWWVETK